jgi:3-oxoacyl-[acyl-carrier-protein] synthase III
MKRPIAMLAATAHAVPKRVFTNDDFASIGVETSDEWIRERTGIRQRFVAGRSRSGLAVPRMIRSSSLAVTPARAIAFRAASVQSEVRVSPSPATNR